MSLFSLTTFDQIRGVLTVSQADLPDEVLDSYGLEDDLAVDLDDWAGDWKAMSAAGAADTASEEDTKRYRLLKLFSKYFCAAQVAATAPVFVLTKTSDGSNEGQRGDSEGFLWLQKAMLTKASQYREKLLDLLNVAPVDSSMTFTSRVAPARDPVTEARSDVS
ncbi:MAG: hypothetical protein KKC02_09110 [Gammaproteobacteria bacterium]|nr:hypothetical protein [Alphaproteobacteria bacterium]MBU1805203.1 hypothetical protein [Gammaproteobacteria bacterium]